MKYLFAVIATLCLPMFITAAPQSPREQTIEKMRALLPIINEYREILGETPRDLKELHRAGFVKDPWMLVDARSPAMDTPATERPGIDWVTTFVMGNTTGVTLATDAPRDGELIAVGPSGKVAITKTGVEQFFGVTAKQSPESKITSAQINSSPAWLGMVLREVKTSHGRPAIVVTAIVPGYGRDMNPVGGSSDVRVGDRIVSINGFALKALADLESYMAKAGPGSVQSSKRWIDWARQPALELIREGRLIVRRPPAPLPQFAEMATTPQQIARRAEIVVRSPGPGQPGTALRAKAIAHIEQTPVTNQQQINQFLASWPAGTTVRVAIQQGNLTQTIDHKLEPMPADALRHLRFDVHFGRFDLAKAETFIDDSTHPAKVVHVIEHRRGADAALDWIDKRIAQKQSSDRSRLFDIYLARTQLQLRKGRGAVEAVATAHSHLLRNDATSNRLAFAIAESLHDAGDTRPAAEVYQALATRDAWRDRAHERLVRLPAPIPSVSPRPQPITKRDRRREVMVENQLRAIGMAAMMYQLDNQRFPPDSGVLLSGNYLTDRNLLSPFDVKYIPVGFDTWTKQKKAEWLSKSGSYQLSGSDKPKQDPKAIIAYERFTADKSHIAVLYGDQRVRILDAGLARTAIEKQTGRKIASIASVTIKPSPRPSNPITPAVPPTPSDRNPTDQWTRHRAFYAPIWLRTPDTYTKAAKRWKKSVVIQLEIADEKESADVKNMVYIRKIPLTYDNLDSYRTWILADWLRRVRGVRRQDESKVKLNTMDARRFVFSWSFDDRKAMAIIHLIMHKGRGYEIACVTSADRFESQRKDFDAIAASVMFEDSDR